MSILDMAVAHLPYILTAVVLVFGFVLVLRRRQDDDGELHAKPETRPASFLLSEPTQRVPTQAPVAVSNPAPEVEAHVLKPKKLPNVGLTLVRWDRDGSFDWNWELTVIDDKTNEVFVVRGTHRGYGAFRYATGVEVERGVQEKLEALLETIKWGYHNDKRGRDTPVNQQRPNRDLS